MTEEIGLYIHIPFCKQKCFYCDFPSFGGREECFQGYVDALAAEMKARGGTAQGQRVKTVFFGGGTPTVLPLLLLQKLMEAVKASFDLVENAEITIEANPGTLDEAMCHGLFDIGFNRLSMGLQAWQNDLLSKLGRIHTVEEFCQNYKVAQAAGFRNISIDLMFALPGQTLQNWRETLRNVIAMAPTHISVYSLIIEEGTPFFEGFQRGELLPVGEEDDRQMYKIAIQMLKEAGYHQYEISNFAKDGFESRHNRIYWETTPYLGMGLGAHSYFDGIRFHNPYDLERYIQIGGEISLLEEEGEVVSRKDAISEFLFLGLRMTKGVSFNMFRSRFQQELPDLFEKEIALSITEGLLEKDDCGIYLTPRGMDLSNLVFERFLLD